MPNPILFYPALARKDAEQTVSNLFGCPGTEWETEDGNKLLAEIVGELGFSALTDEALALLADRHQRHDHNKTVELMRKHSARID